MYPPPIYSRLYMTSLSMGRKTQPTDIYMEYNECPFLQWVVYKFR